MNLHIIYLIIGIILLLLLAAWWKTTVFVRRAKKYDLCYYFRDGKRHTGKLIKKGFFKSYVRDYSNLKVYGVMNSGLFDPNHVRS